MEFDRCEFFFRFRPEEVEVHAPGVDFDVEDVCGRIGEVVDAQGCAEEFGVFGL